MDPMIMKKMQELPNAKDDAVKKDAKKLALGRLTKDVQGMEAETMFPADAKKVTVAADSKEGLEKGLDLAKKTMDKLPEDEMSMEGESDTNEDMVDIMEEVQSLSKEEIDQLLAKLEERKSELDKEEA